MTFRQYIAAMTFASASAWAGWALVLFFVDPLTTGFIGLTLFYVSLCAALSGTLALAGILIRVALFRNGLILSKEVAAAFRQGILASILVVGSLLLQRFSFFTWWTTVLLIIACVCTELFVLTRRPMRPPLPETDRM